MSYQIVVSFSSPNKPNISLSDILDPDDLCFGHYWEDIGDSISCLIASSERKLSQIFPKGHDYIFSEACVVRLEDDEE